MTHGAHACLAISALLLTTQAVAQGNDPLRQPTSVPIDLVTALAQAGGIAGESEPQILVGELPGWVASRLPLPRGTVVMGSAFMGTTVLGIFTFPSPADTVLKFFEQELVQSGWKLPPPTPTYGGGFRPAPTAATRAAMRRITLCGDRQQLAGSLVRQRSGTSTIALRVYATPTAGYSQCNPPQPQPGMTRSPFPTLYNPDATEGPTVASCYQGSAGMGGSGTGTRLRTPMAPDAIVEHYGRQLQDSGWVSSLSLPLVTAARSWTRKDSAGANMVLTLTVSVARDTLCREVNLDLQRPPSQMGRP